MTINIRTTMIMNYVKNKIRVIKDNDEDDNDDNSVYNDNGAYDTNDDWPIMMMTITRVITVMVKSICKSVNITKVLLES